MSCDEARRGFAFLWILEYPLLYDMAYTFFSIFQQFKHGIFMKLAGTGIR